MHPWQSRASPNIFLYIAVYKFFKLDSKMFHPNYMAPSILYALGFGVGFVPTLMLERT